MAVVGGRALLAPALGRLPADLRPLVARAYVPVFLFFLGDGAVLPVIAIAARDLGASTAFAGFVVALRSLGSLAFDLPAGWIVARYGERAAVVFATACVAISLVGWVFVHSPVVFALLAVVQGCGWSVWQLARLSYVSGVAGPALRGRALSLLGGVSRAGWFIGPFLGAGALAVGGFRAVYVLGLVLALVSAACVLRLARPGEGRDAAGPTLAGLREIAHHHSRSLVMVGAVALTISAYRTVRIAVLPLWANHIGFSPEASSAIFGLSVAVELLLVYPGGSVMDRHGRRMVAIPSIALTAIGIGLLPITHSLVPLLAVAIFLGVANGISSGVNMTLGADLAPPDGRAQFLGVWRVIGDVGTATGPLALAGLTAVLSLGGAAAAVGAAGVGIAGVLWRIVPETLKR